MRIAFALVLIACFAVATPAEEPELAPAEGATVHALLTDVETIETWAAELESCLLEHGRLHDLADAQALMPKNLRNWLVVQDGWMQPFKAWCNDQHWAIVSFGANGEPDSDYALLPVLPEEGDDFVVLDGDIGYAPDHIRTLIEDRKSVV